MCYKCFSTNSIAIYKTKSVKDIKDKERMSICHRSKETRDMATKCNMRSWIRYQKKYGSGRIGEI